MTLTIEWPFICVILVLAATMFLLFMPKAKGDYDFASGLINWFLASVCILAAIAIAVTQALL